MTSRIQTNRSSVSRNRPPATRDPGELYVNWADRQIGVMDAASAPMDFVAVRFFATTAEYLVGEMVHHNGDIYRCEVPNGPGAFDDADWTNISEPTEAPLDGETYGRVSGSWTPVLTVAAYDIDKAAIDASLASLTSTKANLASPVFTGNPTAPTAAPGDNDSTIATTAFVTAAVAAGGGGGGATELDDLTDVNSGGATDGQVLTWDNTAGEWVPETPAAVITTLDGLSDVNAPAPTDGHVLTWDSTPGEWVSSAPAAPTLDLDDIADVNAPAPTNGHVLTWDSTPGEWVAAAPAAVAFDLDDAADVNAAAPSNGDVLTWDSTPGEWVAASPKPTESIIVACSDETTALTTGTAKTTFRMPYAFTLSAVRASLTTAQTSGSTFTVDINEAGASVLSTKLTIDNTEKTSITAAAAAVISDAALADDAEITVDIDQVGDGTAKGLKIVLIGARP